ncbi:molybdenum cofactor guanylyltransferase MobA [Ancylobacter pratisalsi]|uniref:Molybdenum cofactor guanylyltransferase n=1 Tax=Ancylobacter pratisalsi TaxID=1745854 RepID=A0A6P1YW91_9HYPH|nr:molybdenum cofactor guanylyltransferase MobA [Ancylobacter pratisalsi]QIB35844.1 molybdenum cofactor guanylyltransferase MobA [Ancylobacter pratisalsi]
MSTPAGLILAGGLSRRMGGGDKALKPLAGSSVLARVVRRLAPQVAPLLLNANGPAERFWPDIGTDALPVVPDTVADHPGPLAGILAGLDHLAARLPGATHLLTVPTDCPFLPHDLAARLMAAAQLTGAACAVSGGRVHGVVGVWSVASRANLRRLLVVDGMRRVDGWIGQARAERVEWPALPYDPFFNVNTPEDLAEAERLLALYPTA